MRASTPTEDELGSTDASTRESAERSALNPAAPEHDDSNYNGRAPTPSDNHSIGSSSFPLLSSTARQGFVEQTRDAPAQYSHPGGYYSAPHHLQMQQQQQQGQMPPLYHYQQHRHLDNYERQHGEDLRQLEDQLRYLQEQHQQLEQEIQERQRLQQDPDGEDVRPRAVRFATQLAQDMEEQGPSDEESNTKDSPTSVAQFNAQDQDKAETSAIAPKALFGRDPGKPKSILRKRNNMDLDANGRYNSNYRGRIAAVTPRFYDTNGREVSPIRSPSRRPNEQQTLYQMDPPPTSDDANSIPENPDDKDIAVLFDSEADIDIELMQREVSQQGDSFVP